MTQIIVFDTETTGIPNWKTPSGGNDQPHLIQLGAHQVDVENQKIIQTMDVIIRPDGWKSEPEALEVHGITEEYAMDVGIPEPLALDMFLAMWNGRTRIAFNTTYDNRIIRIATKRYATDAVVNRWKEGSQGNEWQCMMIASRKIMGGKQPKLVDAYRHFTGKDLENAHTAIADTNACMDIYFAIKAQEGAAA